MTTTNLCGLDFGTSNSEIGIVRDGAPVLVDVENGRKQIPTTIFFDDATRDALRRARRLLLRKNNPLGLVYTLYGRADVAL